MRYEPINPNVFKANRKRLAATLGQDKYLLLKASKGDVGAEIEVPFKQNRNFFWATGIDAPGAAVVLTPGHPDKTLREVLFVKKIAAFERRWNGERLNPEIATKTSGINTVFPLSKLKSFVDSLKQEAADTRAVMAPLRAVKSLAEIELIKRAIGLTALGIQSAIPLIKEGSKEYQIEAELIHKYVSGGGQQSFALVASGQATCTMHYDANDQTLRNGDLLLLDVGAEYANYASDITRVYPISGRFTPRQREVYEAVLRVQEFAITLLKPGALLRDNERAVHQMVNEELVKLGVLTAADIEKSDPVWRASFDYFPHGTSHYLGLDVHDYGDYTIPLEPGTVVTAEPGIYLPKEKIGVRIEDDVLITETGNEVLSAAIPKDPDEIEALMSSRGTK